MAQKVRPSPECRGIKSTQSMEAKISQFADDTTLIRSDINALKESMDVINNLSAISGLKSNKKKKRKQCALVQPKLMKLNLWPLNLIKNGINIL